MMPRYKCHKEVDALKVAGYAVQEDGSILLTFEEEGFAPVTVPSSFARGRQDLTGGYYVVYDDGYASWSPAAAFEAGYTRVQP